MLQFYNTNIKNIKDKYKNQVVELMSNPEFSILQESQLHTNNIARCSRGSEEAKEYVTNYIKKILREIVTDNDMKIMMEVINKEHETYTQKLYETMDLKGFSANQERKITYYQLLCQSCSEKQKQKLEYMSRKLYDTSLSIDILAEELYKTEYGLNLIDDIKDMRLNNIEVHDTRKIRVEVADGNWYTISDCTFEDNESIRTVAKRLVNQNSGGDLTEDECERESQLLDDSRITIALKPASNMDTIFIKMFNNSFVKEEDMIVNGTVTEESVECLKIAAKGRLNSIFIGGVNCGKTTLFKLYMGFMPTDYKIGIVDPSKDTDLTNMYPEKDIITLYETPTYSMNDQFSKLLRMNRQILGVSEARSYEVEQLIKSMLRGNSGSSSTLHTTNAKDLIDNMAWMCLENGIPQDMNVLRSRIASAIDIVPRVKYFPNGARRLDDISEIVATGDIQNPFEIRKIFKWDYDKNELVRNKDYKPSDDLIDKLRYYGCTDKEIRRFAYGNQYIPE